MSSIQSCFCVCDTDFIECACPSISLCVKCQRECAPATKNSRLSLRGKKPTPPRFNFVSKDEEEEIRKSFVTDNTQRSTLWALIVFFAWLKSTRRGLPFWFTGTGSWRSVQVACSLCITSNSFCKHSLIFAIVEFWPVFDMNFDLVDIDDINQVKHTSPRLLGAKRNITYQLPWQQEIFRGYDFWPGWYRQISPRSKFKISTRSQSSWLYS